MNIAKILKNCPKGMKLYSPIYGEVEFIEISVVTGDIVCKFNGGTVYFHPDGVYYKGGECMLFPSKEQRDWDEFMIPFKDGDIIIKTEFNPGCKQYNIAIFKGYNNNTLNKMNVYCQVNGINEFKTGMSLCHRNWRMATAEEGRHLFDRMHESGYYFKDDKLTRLFKYGDVVAFRNEIWGGYNIGIFDKYLNDTFCKVLCITLISDGSVNIVGEGYDIGRGWDTKSARLATTSERLDLFEKLAKIGYKWDTDKLVPIAKFEVGNIITNGTYTFKISHVDELFYYEEAGITVSKLLIQDQDKWKIKKFDIHSLKPYDKVLVKYHKNGCWVPTMISYVEDAVVYTIDIEDSPTYVIPYENNEHLVAKYDDPDPYYITW